MTHNANTVSPNTGSNGEALRNRQKEVDLAVRGMISQLARFNQTTIADVTSRVAKDAPYLVADGPFHETVCYIWREQHA